MLQVNVTSDHRTAFSMESDRHCWQTQVTTTQERGFNALESAAPSLRVVKMTERSSAGRMEIGQSGLAADVVKLVGCALG